MELKIALAGNPNCGKTTLFNALTGSNQYVGNWPGVTVEKKEGKLKGHKEVVIQDLPGIYSLSPYTLEEVVLRAIGAGADILLFGNNLEYDPAIVAKVQAVIVRAVEDGTLSRARLEASWRRILKLKQQMS